MSLNLTLVSQVILEIFLFLFLARENDEGLDEWKVRGIVVKMKEKPQIETEIALQEYFRQSLPGERVCCLCVVQLYFTLSALKYFFLNFCFLFLFCFFFFILLRQTERIKLTLKLPIFFKKQKKGKKEKKAKDSSEMFLMI